MEFDIDSIINAHKKFFETSKNKKIDLSAIFSIFCNSETCKIFFARNYENPEKDFFIRMVNKLIFNETLTNFGFFYIFLDCTVIITSITLKPNEIYTLDLSSEIEDGKLLYINYTPNCGNLFPLEIHGNCPIGNEYRIKKLLYPYVLDKNLPVKTNVSVQYIYALGKLTHKIGFNQLIEGFEYFSKKNYVTAIIKLQIACEFIL